jgi:hypothetical protein
LLNEIGEASCHGGSG